MARAQAREERVGAIRRPGPGRTWARGSGRRSDRCDEHELLRDKGVLAPYESPAAEGYPEWARPDDTIQLFGIEYVSYLFNKDRVAAADAPRPYEDLAGPKWKNQIVMANPANHASSIS